MHTINTVFKEPVQYPIALTCPEFLVDFVDDDFGLFFTFEQDELTILSVGYEFVSADLENFATFFSTPSAANALLDFQQGLSSIPPQSLLVYDRHTKSFVVMDILDGLLSLGVLHSELGTRTHLSAKRAYNRTIAAYRNRIRLCSLLNSLS